MNYSFDFASLLPHWHAFLGGLWLTTQLSFSTTILGFVFGTLLAIGLDTRGWVAVPCRIYVELIRNTPLLVQLFVVFFVFPSLGWKISAMSAAVIALGVNLAAYASEVIRAGIQSVHHGQIEAAECLGLNKAQIYWHVILMPAIEKVYPALCGQFVLLMLASSLTSQISVNELTGIAGQIQSETFRSFETYTVIAGLYLLLAFSMRLGLWLLGMLIFTRRRRLGSSISI
ncbi:amino acid ABC transporter permease [Castellaniella sp. GW247-6E4]|uniref:amino acid ABC transporter permease n=1 Tax=Castellaniella sp. GW247-6E4 TaxID=3140380 RepID=UPI0033160297